MDFEGVFCDESNVSCSNECVSLLKNQQVILLFKKSVGNFMLISFFAKLTRIPDIVMAINRYNCYVSINSLDFFKLYNFISL